MRRQLKYRRLLLKLSGEAFGQPGQGIDYKKLDAVARELASLRRFGIELGVVVGGGNIWRKRDQGRGMDPDTADYLGLLATVMNGLALRQALRRLKVLVVVQAAVAFDIPLAEPVNGARARKALAQGKIVIFAGGTGEVGFTTDTSAALAAGLVKADVIIKTGPVDGVYTADPLKVKSAKRFSTLTIREALRRRLEVMDRAAFLICAKKKIPIVVCKWKSGLTARAVLGKPVGTLVTP